MSDQAFLLLQRGLPKRRLTEFLGWLATRRGGRATRWAIERFIARYRVDMSEAAEPDPRAYPTFNDFFTRALAEGARPLARADWICPVDGAVSQCAAIDDGLILQAKGHRYRLDGLLADPHLAGRFEGGAFATLYLSPRDYHRIHMPAAGRLVSMTHVPGTLYSVNPVTVSGIPDLFAINERVVCVFERQGEPFVMVLVGATIVGSMATVWHGLVNPPRPGTIRYWRYEDRDVRLAQGEEMGRFLLGSTVILIVPKSQASGWPDWSPGRPVRLGEAMA
jgi:phosphatidylserine decarboxylase